MDGRLRPGRRLAAVSLLLLLIVCAAPAAALAQQFVCRPIVRGDTVSRLALQLTGNARAAYTHAFQIRDPARRMFVPKSQYRRPLRTHWEACVAVEPIDAPLALAPLVAAGSPTAIPESAVTPAPVTLAAAPSVPGPTGGSKYGMVYVATIGSVVVATVLIGAALGGSLASRPIPPELQRVGEEFVVAFARPLIDSSSTIAPIHARLRFIEHAGQLEISIAPGPGRRYPNLIDHKKNVEYDVRRVVRELGAGVVLSDRLRAAGKWVVVPVRLAEQIQTGAK